MDDDLTGHRLLAGAETHLVGVDGEDRPAPDPLAGDQLPPRFVGVSEAVHYAVAAAGLSHRVVHDWLLFSLPAR